MAEIFISYSSLDAGTAQAVVTALEASGHTCWVAPRDIPPGADWSSAIPPAIDGCRLVVLIFSARANASEEVRREVHLARGSRRLIIPFRIEQVEPEGALRFLLAGVQWLDALREPRDERIAQLVSRVGLSPAVDEMPLIDRTASTPNNLPDEATSFHGRETEILESSALIAAHPLVTLVGPGGVGKSRLAMHIARRLLDDYSDGVWFVALAPISNPELIPAAVADVLEARETSANSLVDEIAKVLADRSVLLVLDNCEHLLAACCALATALLKGNPSLRILATSREHLGIKIEHRCVVEPLASPRSSASHTPTMRDLEASPAAALLLERARTLTALPILDDQQRRSVSTICNRLDGIPLALELAAARTGALTFQQIAQRLDERLRFFRSRDATAEPRQQTLRALIEWSYELLSEDERAIFRRLGVIAGRFGLDAAVAVTERDEFDVLDVLESLLNKSLLGNAGVGAGERYYAMLESIRQFAIAELRATAEYDSTLERRLQFWQRRAAEAEAGFSVPAGRWRERLEAELDELRAIVDWSLAQERLTVNAVDILYHVAQFWHDTARFAEANRAFSIALRSEVVRSAAHIETRAKALFGAGLSANFLDRPSEATRLLEEALPLFTQLGDRANEARVLNMLGLAAQNRGDRDAAIGYFERCIERKRVDHDVRGEMIAMTNLATSLQYDPNRINEAESLFEKALAFAREKHETAMTAHILTSLVDVADYCGDTGRAATLARESLALWQELRNDVYVAEMMGRLAWLELEFGNRETAMHYLAQSLPALVEQNVAADIANAVVFLARATTDRQPEIGTALLTFADDLRRTSERAPTLFENRFRAVVADIISRKVTEQTGEQPALRTPINLASILQMINQKV